MLKLVATRSSIDAGAWSNSTALRGELVEEVSRRKATQDLVVAGSLSVSRALIAHGLVDEYRLLVFPTAVAEGARLFDGTAELRLTAVEPAGPAVLLTYVPA
jgi:dihydrofolate reductase